MPDVDKMIMGFFEKMKWKAKATSEGVFLFMKEDKTFTLALAGNSGGAEIHHRFYVKQGFKPNVLQQKVAMWGARLGGIEDVDQVALEWNLNSVGIFPQVQEPGGRMAVVLTYNIGDMSNLKRAIENGQDFIGYCDFLTEYAQAVEEVEKAG
ncbi:Uncharacterised protein [uncultured archaeon]|nr:Uncharacterised protein [uncultured archaeon]